MSPLAALVSRCSLLSFLCFSDAFRPCPGGSEPLFAPVPPAKSHENPSHKWLSGEHGFSRAEELREFRGFNPSGAQDDSSKASVASRGLTPSFHRQAAPVRSEVNNGSVQTAYSQVSRKGNQDVHGFVALLVQEGH